MSLLEISHQRWKLFLFITLMALGAGVTLGQGFLFAPLGRELTMQLVVGAMLAIVATFFWACQSIACPQCEHRLFWHAITKVGFSSWFVWLLTEEKCPKCGYNGRSDQPAGKGKKSGRH